MYVCMYVYITDSDSRVTRARVAFVRRAEPVRRRGVRKNPNISI